MQGKENSEALEQRVKQLDKTVSVLEAGQHAEAMEYA